MAKLLNLAAGSLALAALVVVSACSASVRLPQDWVRKGHFFAQDSADKGPYLCAVGNGPPVANPKLQVIAEHRARAELVRYFAVTVAPGAGNALTTSASGELPAKVVARESFEKTPYAVACVELSALRAAVERGKASVKGLSKEALLKAVDAAIAASTSGAPDASPEAVGASTPASPATAGGSGDGAASGGASGSASEGAGGGGASGDGAGAPTGTGASTDAPATTDGSAGASTSP